MVFVNKRIIFILSILLSTFLFPKNVFAGKYPTTFEGVSHKQGWLVPNDYTTRMNPPSCKTREATETEVELLSQECDKTDSCYELVSQWVEQWSQYYCSEIGMSIRTNEDGKKVAFFEDTKPAEEKINEQPAPTIQPTVIENNGKEISSWDKVIAYLKSIIEKMSSFFHS